MGRRECGDTQGLAQGLTAKDREIRDRTQRGPGEIFWGSSKGFPGQLAVLSRGMPCSVPGSSPQTRLLSFLDTQQRCVSGQRNVLEVLLIVSHRLLPLPSSACQPEDTRATLSPQEGRVPGGTHPGSLCHRHPAERRCPTGSHTVGFASARAKLPLGPTAEICT